MLCNHSNYRIDRLTAGDHELFVCDHQRDSAKFALLKHSLFRTKIQRDKNTITQQPQTKPYLGRNRVSGPDRLSVSLAKTCSALHNRLNPRTIQPKHIAELF